MSVFANLFGYVLEFLYRIVGNYGWAIILFSILVKLIMIPLTMKQQKTLKKNEELQDEMKKIQFKYKNDPEKLNQELMELYKREGMSPLSGCFSSIIQLILLFSVFLLVRSPLTYMVKMDADVIQKMEAIVAEQDSTVNKTYQEISVIQYVKNLESTDSVSENDDEMVDNEVQNIDEVNEIDEESGKEGSESDEDKFNIYDYKDQANLNMDFFGIDLSQVPTQNLTDWKTLIIPVLYVISSFVSIKLTTSLTNKKKEDNDKKLITDGQEENKEEYNPMQDANKTMSWMMPIMSISIAIIAPLGLALYWLMNNILMIIERLVFNKIFDNKGEAKENV
jgi:YidC/Oxa1 family membrane protein insertase